MRLPLLLASGLCACAPVLDADFEADTIGSLPAPAPTGAAGDRIDVLFGFDGEVIAAPVTFPDSAADRSLLVFSRIAGPTLAFISEPINPARRTDPHRVSLLLEYTTTRRVEFELSNGPLSLGRVIFEEDRMTLGLPFGERETFDLETNGRPLRLSFSVDPVARRTLIAAQVFGGPAIGGFQRIGTGAPPGEFPLESLTLEVGFPQGEDRSGRPGRIVIDEIFGVYAPRVTSGGT